MRGLLVAMMLLIGCDQVLGLSRPDAPRDDDEDGIQMDLDNCPTIANTDQVDTDLDGRGDACDQCPLLAEVNEHDDDGDGVGDRCDNCPHVASPDQGNLDGDDLGNICDGSAATECIALFDPFQTMPVAERMVGTWTIIDEELHQTDTAIESIFVFAMPAVAEPALEIAARVVATPADPSTLIAVGAWVAVRDGASAILPAGLVSEVRWPFGGSMVTTWLYTSEASATGNLTVVGALPLLPTVAMTAGSTVKLRLQLTSASEFFARGDVAQSSETNTGFMTAQPVGKIGLRANRVATAFTYMLVVVESGSACPLR